MVSNSVYILSQLILKLSEEFEIMLSIKTVNSLQHWRLKIVDLSVLVGFALTLTARLYQKESRLEGSMILNSSSAKQIFTQKFESFSFQIEYKIN